MAFLPLLPNLVCVGGGGGGETECRPRVLGVGLRAPRKEELTDDPSSFSLAILLGSLQGPLGALQPPLTCRGRASISVGYSW